MCVEAPSPVNLKVFGLLSLISWFFVLQSGMHATVAGVLLALVIPIKRKIAPENFRDDPRAGIHKGRFEEVEAKVANFERVLGNAQSPLHLLHPWVASWSCWSSRSSTPASL